MTLLLIVLLVVALCVSIRIIVLLRRNLADSEDLTAALVLDNNRLVRKNVELTVISATLFTAARRNGDAATALATENADLRQQNDGHVTSLTMLLTEMEKVQ